MFWAINTIKKKKNNRMSTEVNIKIKNIWNYELINSRVFKVHANFVDTEDIEDIANFEDNISIDLIMMIEL